MATKAHAAEAEHHHVVLEPVLEIPPPVIQLLAPNNIGDLFDPDAVRGTRFSGPLISGNADDGIPGVALLHKRAKIGAIANGAFSIPVRFPPSSIVTQMIVQLQQSYNGLTPKINLGTTINGVDVASFDVSVAPTQLLQNITSLLTTSWTLYLSQALGAGNTAGKCTALIFYSVPAVVVPS